MTAKDFHEVHDDEKVGDIERAAGSQTEDGSPTITSSDSVTIRSNPDATNIKAEEQELSHNATATTATTGHVTAPSDTKEAAPETQATAAAVQGPPPAAAPGAEDTPEAGRTKLETTLIVLSLCAALFLAALDVTIITTAVPTIAEEFNSNIGYIWIGSAYLLSNAAFVPTWGKISDIWGRKPILLCAVGVFWVGSLICGLSTSMGYVLS